MRASIAQLDNQHTRDTTMLQQTNLKLGTIRLERAPPAGIAPSGAASKLPP